MTMTSHMPLTGAKGGASKPKTPVEAPDSLQSTNIAKLLLAVGEGEFDGTPTDQDIYLDNTPIRDANGALNFPGVKWEWRPGTPEQDYIQGIPAVENETSVGVELRSDTPFTRALTDLQLSAVRVRMAWPRLLSQDSNGNTNGYRIEYAIDIATDGGAYVEAHRGAVDGKTNNGYQRSVRVNLPVASSGWTMRVRRLTPNADKGAIADTMTIAGYTEIIDQKLRYPNTALLYIEFDAQQFQNIPAVTVDCKGRRWPVPSNYDPVTRRYDGVWDGSFKHAWTNNPAFVTYGLCVEDRFGLGKRIKPWMVDKWEMYRIAQFCDQAVPDGKGGEEPRFLCDMNLQGRAEAWTLLRDLSAIYRGMVYWAHGALFMQADMPRAQDIDYVFTRANVIDGDFVYGGAERNTHYSRALVSYDNPANNYDTDVIPVTDLALQRRYRDRPVEISAIGCTRASEAQRRGKWALLSNDQDRTVTFKTGLEGRIPLPGFVIPVADELVAGRPNGGRIAAAEGRVVTLDRDTPIKAGDRLVVNLPNGTAQARTVAAVTGRAVTVTTAYAVQPEPQLQWAIDYDDLAIQLFRVLKTTRTEDGHYAITALEFNPSKFAAIDNGAKLDERPISVLPSGTVQPPAQLTLSSSYRIDQGIAVSTLTLEWSAVEGAAGYDVEWRRDNGNWIRLPRTGITSVDVPGIYAGAYLARVRAISAFELASSWTHSALTSLKGKEGAPPALTRLTTESLIFGIGLTWGFPAGAGDTQRTELWYSEGTDLDKAAKLADLAYPQDRHTLQGLRAGQRFYFWARLVDKSGNVGVWFPAEGGGVSGAASADAGPILEQIKDQITASELGKELTSEIEKIALIDGNGPGSVNERVGSIKNELARQIGDVNSSLSGVNTTLEGQISTVSKSVADAKSELQQQITAVSTLAGSLPYRKDKTYSTNQNALGSDGRLYQALKAVPLNMPPPNATYWTDVGQAVVTAAGTAASVTKLQTDVATLDDKITATSGKVDGFQASLNNTNDNVAKKADASAVNSLKLTVEQQGRDLTSQGTTLNGMQTMIDSKASSQALTQLSNRVKLTEDKDGQQDETLRSQSESLTTLKDTVNKKAEASTVTQLANDVKTQGNTLSAQGLSLTKIEASLPSLSGENILANSSFEDAIADGSRPRHWAVSGVAARAFVPSPLTSSLNAFRMTASVAPGSYIEVVSSPADGRARVKVTAGVTYTLSVYARGSGVPGFLRMYLQFLDAAGAVLSAPSTSDKPVLGDNFTRYTLTGTAPANATQVNVYACRLFNDSNAAATIWAEIDNVQLQEGLVATAYQPSIVATADASAEAVTSLGARVEKNEQGLKSSGERVTRLTNSLTITDGNVDKAQKAALDAYGLADGKGKVIVQNAAPGTGDRLPQNLWIDTTGGANTPKRWNGSAWAAVTDKVATDAAAAAQNALNQLGGKADASALSTLGSTVEQQGRDITAAGQSITRIDASIASAGSENLLFNPSFDIASAANANIAAGWYWRYTAGVAVVPTLRNADLGAEGKCQRLDVSGLTAGSGASYVDFVPLAERQPPVFGGVQYTASVYARGNTGLLLQVYMQFKDAAGNTLSTNGPSNLALNLTYQRPLLVSALAPNDSVRVDVLYRIRSNAGSNLAAGFVDFDMAQLEQGNTLTGWRDNGKANADSIAVNAAATTALTGRVEKTEQGLTSASGSITQLENSIGDIGGENLLFNPTFNKYASLNGWPEGWETEGPVTSVDTLVPSWMNSGEKAQRVVTSGLNTSSAYKSVRTSGSKRIAVAGGQAVTASAYVRRGSDPVSMRIFIQWMNASDTVISAPASAMIPLSMAGDRIQYTAVAPVDAVKAYVYYRGYGPTASTTPATFEVARPQAEYGAKATGWRDNGQVAATQQAATSTVVDKLVSTVDQQGRDLTSYSSRTTTLENNLTITDGNVGKAQKAAQDAYGLADGKGKVLVQNTAPGAADRLVQNLWIDTTGGANTPKRWTGTAWQAITDKVATDAAAAAQNALGQVATKADASAVTDLTSRVKKTEDGVSTQAGQLTQLKASIGSAQPFVSGYSWDMTGSNRGWGANTSSATMTPGPAFSTVSGYTTIQATNSFGLLSGTLNPYLRIRLRRRNTNRATAAMYWANEDGGLAEARRLNWTIDITTTDWQDIELDLSGHAGWNGKTGISAIRLDMMSGNETNPQIDIAYIAVGRRSAAASAMAVSDLEVALSKQGEKITGEVGRLDQLYLDVDGVRGDIKEEARLRIEDGKALALQTTRVQTNLNGTNAAIERTSKALTALNGVASASEVVRVQITANGIRHVGGFGIGIQNTDGAVQSTFAVLADRFAILSPAGDSVSPPFATQGNQTFISDAYIREASITNAKIADAAITTAKIGDLQVSTLKIGNEAVTIPRYAGHAPRYECNGQWQAPLTINFFMPQAGMVLINFSANRVSNGAQTYEYNIALDGIVLAGAAAIGTESSITTGAGQYVGPGQHTVVFSIKGSPGVALFFQNLTVQGIMR
ncbi:TipJ family phage tail tip protein [Pseudomonas alabamensis]|uniref:phage tail protein n=1 Tax=Pseudomonas alabamensis TaxID=3064349 RepID=UPI003F649886